MFSRSRPLLPFAVLVFAAFSAHAQSKPRVVALELLPIDPEVSKAVSKQLSADLHAELGATFALVPDSEVEALRQGAVKPPDISKATTMIANAKEQLGQGNWKAAQKSLRFAAAILEPVKPKLRDYTPITSTLLYTAVAAMNGGDKKGAAQAFSQLARVRPDFRVDPAEFPPNVIDAFQKAKAAEDKLPRGRLVVNSTPPKARVFVDELPVGVTPVAVPASAGDHVIRVELAGHLDFVKAVTVESYAKLETQVTLEPNAVIEALKQLENLALNGGAPGTFSEPATTVCNALEADAVVLGVVALSVKGYLTSVAYIASGDAPRVSIVDLERSLEDKKQPLTKLAAAIAAAARGEPVKDGNVGAAPTRKVDLKKMELGVGPGGSGAVLAEAAKARTVVNVSPDATVVEKPSRTWVWVVVAVAVAAAAGGGTAAYFATRPPSGVQFELERQR